METPAEKGCPLFVNLNPLGCVQTDSGIPLLILNIYRLKCAKIQLVI
jgi:hypothetical protein